MSKKSKKAAQTRKPVPTRAGRDARPTAARGRTHPYKDLAQPNLQAVRILAAVLAVICLAGIAAVLITIPAPYAAPTVIEIVLLAFITGFCVFTAIRPDATVRWFRRLAK